jgi:hypothetical protein
MEDQQATWATRPGQAWDWAMGWVNEAGQGMHTGVQRIHEAAVAYKDRFCTDGLWVPGTDIAYDMLREAADMAQAEYEAAQPGME